MTVRKRKPLSDKAKLAHYQAQVQLARMKEQEKLRKKQLADQKKAQKERARIEKAGGKEYVAAKKKHTKFVHKKQMDKWGYEQNPVRNVIKRGRSFWRGNKL